MTQSEHIRETTLKTLSTAGLLIDVKLPLIDPVNLKRSTVEVVSRALAMTAIAASSYGFDKSRALDWLVREELLAALTGDEVKFLKQNHPPEKYLVYPEAIYSLSWIAGFYKEIDFWGKCPTDLVSHLPDLRREEKTSKWFETASLREVSELFQKLDIAYCCHWAVRERVAGWKSFFKTDLSGVYFRRLPFEWVFSDEEWDEITLDT